MYAANFEAEPGVGHESKVCSFRKRYGIHVCCLLGKDASNIQPIAVLTFNII